MSDDLFGSDPDEPLAIGGGKVLTPLEFSGVSGGSSPPSQHYRLPTITEQQEPPTSTVLSLVPGRPGPSTSSGTKEYKCPSCKKKPYKTFRGYKKHMCEKHKINVTDTVEPTSSIPIASSSASSTAVIASSASTSEHTKETFTCSECGSVLETKRGFLTHRAAHRIKEINLRKPNASQFKEEALINTMDKIMEELLSEPAYGEPKEKILQEFNNKKGTSEWSTFVLYLTDNIWNFICDDKQSKLFPINQYEVALAKLNSLLNCQSLRLREMFLAVCVDADNFFINRLIFCIASKLLSHVQIWLLKKMRSVEENPTDLCEEMSELEEKNFACDLGHFLRKRFKKYRNKKDVYCACMRSTFVDGEHPISTNDFLNEKNWFSGEEKCIIISQRAFQFFQAIEFSIIV